jgi:hypothetical protein
MTDINLGLRANIGDLTVEEVNAATKHKLEEDTWSGVTVLYLASICCEIEIVEAILDKGVNIDGLSSVSIGDVTYYQVIVIKLTHFNYGIKIEK